jgi:hypothetical protein
MVKPRTNKKLAKRGRDITQYCIDGYLVDEVLEQIPANVKIIGAKVFVGQSYSKHKKAIPTALRKLGVQSLREHKPALDATLVFDEVNKSAIKTSVKEVCKKLNESPEKAYFMYVTLKNGTSTGKFVHTTKERVATEADLRKKARVLGLEDVDGDAKGLIKALSAKKYVCSISTQEVRTIMCTTVR